MNLCRELGGDSSKSRGVKKSHVEEDCKSIAPWRAFEIGNTEIRQLALGQVVGADVEI